MLQNNLDAYNESAESFDKKIASLANYNEAYNVLASCLKPGDDVLDTACGPGNISRFLDKKVPELKFTMMDLSQEMLKISKKYLPNAEILCGDICSFSLGKKFDAVVNGFGLPYLSPEEACRHFEAVYNHLKPGGIYYLSFMNVNEKNHPDENFYTQTEHPSFNPVSTITVTYYSQNVIEKQLKAKGFSMLRKWNLDYKEPDGSITTDVVLILKK